ncbi:hypothetical protein Tco_0195777 [Tanacetum coccineum]
MNKKNLFLLKDMDQDSAHMVAASKVPMLKPGEYEIWRMRIEQYIQMIDYALWEVIENGATLPKTKIVEGVMTEMPITTAEEKAQRRLEVKARSTLMMGIPNEHQLKFNSIKDAKKLLEAVEKRFGGNAATRKTQRNLLKQQYENFTAPSSEMLDQTFDRLQKLVSQLELLDEKLSQEDVNQKLLRSLSPEWNTHAVVWRNKADLDTMSMDDLYNNLKVYEPEVKGMSSSSSSTQNMAFVSSSNNNTSSTNEAVNTAHRVSTASTQVNAANSTNIDNLSDAVICAFFASQPNSPQLVHEDLQQIHPDDMEEMDLRWQMAILTMRARRKAYFEEYNKGALLCKAPKIQDNKNKAAQDRSVPVNIYFHSFGVIESGEIAIGELRKKLETVQKEKDGIQLNVDKFEHASKSLNKLIECQIVDNCKKAMSSKEEPKVVRKNDDAPIIEEWVSDDKEEDVTQHKTEKKTVRPSIVKKEFVKSTQQEKLLGKLLNKLKQQKAKHSQSKQAPKKLNNIYLTSCLQCVPVLVTSQSKVLHLYAVKRIFRLISWQCKKPTVVANYTTEAEYVAASSCCGQVLWIQNQLLDYSHGLKTINGEIQGQVKEQLHALVDGKKIIITESSVRRDLQLADEEGVDCLPNSTIFEQLTLMGCLSPKILPEYWILSNEAVHKELGDSLVRAATTALLRRELGQWLKRLYKVGLTAKVESSDNKESLGEDASKQGRIDAIDVDEEITLVSVHDGNVSAGEEVFAY